jgi:hypothetical protein
MLLRRSSNNPGVGSVACGLEVPGWRQEQQCIDSRISRTIHRVRVLAVVLLRDERLIPGN